MLAEAKKEAGDSDTLIIPIPEPSDILDPLLRFAYPIPDPVMNDLRDISIVLAMALEYQMEEAISLLKELLCAYIPSDPLRVWAIACLLRLEDEARAAADSLLGRDLPDNAPREFEELSAGNVYRLASYHKCNGNVEDAFLFWGTGPLPADAAQAEEDRKKVTCLAYDLLPYADIICRSSDGKDFHAHKVMLSMVSPVLRDQIARLSATETSSSAMGSQANLPILVMDEPGNILESILALCYASDKCDRPVRCFDLHLGVTFMLMVCARKYKMNEVLDLLGICAFGSSLRDRPLASYLLASKLKFKDFVKRAVQEIREDLLEHGHVPEMENTHGNFYYRLLINRRRLTAAASRWGKAGATRAKPRSAAGKNPRTPSVVEENARLSSASSCAWLAGLLKETRDGLRNLKNTGSFYRLDRDVVQLMNESLDRRVWCQPCEGNVRAMIEMKEIWNEAYDTIREHDKLTQV
ncbi:hypothetical protein C8Q74DRAFT_1431988 [Fomes fomentarius]|nr:hypothetical protein C8Q74DRAFT_1431988 [Fomes fomentarius]